MSAASAKANRSSNVELMRIICILMVIGGHYYTHGCTDIEPSGFNLVFCRIFGGCSKLAVNCFVIITGFFGRKLTTKRIFGLIKDRWFYSVFLSAILIVTGGKVLLSEIRIDNNVSTGVMQI